LANAFEPSSRASWPDRFYAVTSTRLPVPCPFCTRKLASACNAPWVLPELSEVDIWLIRVSSGLVVLGLVLEVFEASSAFKSACTVVASVLAAAAFPEVRSSRSEVTSLVRLSEDVLDASVATVASSAARSFLSWLKSALAEVVSPAASAFSSETISCVRILSALGVVLAALDAVLAVAELTELVELAFVVAVKAAASALSRSAVVEEIAEIDMMPLPEMPDTHPCSLSAGVRTNFKVF